MTRNVVALPFFFAGDRERGPVTRKVFAHYARMSEELGFEMVGVGSEGAVSRNLWREFFPAGNYHEYPQTWSGGIEGDGSALLRAKFDETVRAAARFDPERVFIGGSDDLIGVEFYRRAFSSAADLVGIGGGARIVRLARREVHVWDGRYDWAPDVECCGGGLVFSRRLLDCWDWAPFSELADEVGIERRARAEGASIEVLQTGRDGFEFHAVKVEQAVLNGFLQWSNVQLTEAPRGMYVDFAALWDAL